MATNASLISNTYDVPKGYPRFGAFDSLGNPGAMLEIGNSNDINFTSEQEALEHFDFISGEKDDEEIIRINRSGTLVTDNMSLQNTAMFTGANKPITVSQASDTVTNEYLDVLPDSWNLLGLSATTPAGIRNATITAVRNNDPAVTWSASTAVLEGHTIVDTGRVYRALNAGTTGGSSPTFPTTEGNTVVDNNVTWEDQGATATYTADDDYITDQNGMMLGTPKSGAVKYLRRIWVDYSLPALTYDSVPAGSLIAREGVLVISPHIRPGRPNRIHVFRRARLSPQGNIVVQSENFVSMSFKLDILKPLDGSASWYIDGQPVLT